MANSGDSYWKDLKKAFAVLPWIQIALDLGSTA
jgi:hypothetical protein